MTAACGAVAATALGCSASNDAKATWTWTQDDDLPVLCMQVSGGAIVAMPGSGWKPQDGWIQVQLSGGSIPGKEIESIIQERKNGGEFSNLKDFIERLSGKEVNKRTIESFIKSGAFDSLGGTRKQFMVVYVQILDQVNRSVGNHLTICDLVRQNGI